jgi:ABC-type nitrate/sulfonate/bicarbonate transport system ATPase subunit
MSIHIENLSKHFGSHLVLNELSFTLPEGKCIALLGASGCGKSVLFHTLAGLLPIESGQLLINEQPVANLEVSYMRQKDLLLPWYSLLDNASLPLQLSGMPRAQAHQQVSAHLGRFGLQDFGHHYPDQLSGGMRQRVALLRTLMYEKPLVLMDEPFSALDALTAYELRMFVQSVQKQLGFTLFFITHNVDEALDLADEIWLMQSAEHSPQVQKMEHLPERYEDKRAYLLQQLGVATR